MPTRIDRSNMRVRKSGFQFKPFRPTDSGSPLQSLDLAGDDELLVFERGGERRGLLLPQMVYHHVAQGELAGEPYLVTF
jgi:hypothetical protein